MLPKAVVMKPALCMLDKQSYSCLQCWMVNSHNHIQEDTGISNMVRIKGGYKVTDYKIRK
jgi:hypothetical protein